MPAMTLTILGSGTAVPSKRRAAPGYLLDVGGDRLVFDSGPGTLGRLLTLGVAHDEVSHLFYSHNHLDHCAELPAWLFTGRIPASERTSPLWIGASAGFMEVLGSLRSLYGDWLDARSYCLGLLTLAPGSTARGEDWSVEAFAVNHIESSLAYRLEGPGGRVFVYTGDTDVSEDLIPLCRDADLLLIEASTPDEDKLDGHLTPSEAGRIATRAGARKVVLTHFYPPCDEVDMLSQLRRTCSAEAVLAEDGIKMEV